MRKPIALTLAICLMFSMMVSPVFSATTEEEPVLISTLSFKDVPSTHWANSVISSLTQRGIISGYKDGSFRPDEKVTRAEFAKMVALFMSLPIYEVDRVSFKDIDKADWASKYIEACFLQALITGYPDGTYKPANNIKRSEIASILVSANSKLRASGRTAAATKYKPFSDIAGNWAEADITTMRNLGILNAYPDGLFRPEQTATRAEAAKMLYLLLQNVQGIKITPPTSSSGGGGSTEPSSAIKISKTGPSSALLGDTVDYSIIVTNGAETTLTAISVTDNKADADKVKYISGDVNEDKVLDLEEIWTYEVKDVYMPLAGSTFTNTATVTGKNPKGATVSAEGSHKLTLRSQPPEPGPGCPDESYDPDIYNSNTEYLAIGHFYESDEDQSMYLDNGKYSGTRIDVYSGTIDEAMVRPDDSVIRPETVELPDVNIGFYYEGNLPATPAMGVQVSDVIVINKDNPCNFAKPIEVTIPFVMSQDVFEGGDRPSVFYWDPCSEKYIAVGLSRSMVPTSVDYDDGEAYKSTITFKTVHGGKFVALAVPHLQDRIFGDSTNLVDTGFRPGIDGFVQPAFGNERYPDRVEFEFPGTENADVTRNGGTSIGMAGYAMWFYATQKDSGPGLRQQAYSSIIERELIARSYAASSVFWTNRWIDKVESIYDYHDAWGTGLQLIQTMLITGSPQMLYANFANADDAYHTNLGSRALIVYAYDPMSYSFMIYDPAVDIEGDSSATPRELQWADGWGDYEQSYDEEVSGIIFEEFEFDGLSSILRPAQFKTLSEGAGGNWADSRFGSIEVINLSDEQYEGVYYNEPIDLYEIYKPYGEPSPMTVQVTKNGVAAPADFKYLSVIVNGVDGFDSMVLPINPDGTCIIPMAPIFEKAGFSDFSMMMYATNNVCPTVRKCAQPNAAFTEITAGFSADY